MSLRFFFFDTFFLYLFFTIDVVVSTLFVWEAKKYDDYCNQEASDARTCPPDSPCCSAL